MYSVFMDILLYLIIYLKIIITHLLLFSSPIIAIVFRAFYFVLNFPIVIKVVKKLKNPPNFNTFLLTSKIIFDTIDI